MTPSSPRKGTPRANGTGKNAVGQHNHTLLERERCVKAVLEQGRTSLDVAAEFGVPSRTIRHWVQEAGTSLAKIGQEKMEECAELALEYLGLNLQALNTQAKLFADKRWLSDTDSDKINSIAISHGILADKSFRFLEAAQRASERAGSNPAQLAPASGD